ncbi:MAG TPA: hypothetical protein VN174_02420 [Candidatus Methanoperedens sp.]|nr:hypothetical protein [Candidatus Methanoperedens sp.]
MEIERKFLVAQLPLDLNKYPYKKIVQGYLAISEDGTEVRIRQKGADFFETVKRGGGLTRAEYEIEIEHYQFDSLWPVTEGKRIEKTRYEIEHEGRVVELDIYLGNLSGLQVVEVEFSSEEESKRYNIPDWFGEEITDDKRYKNQSLALYGLPGRRQ